MHATRPYHALVVEVVVPLKSLASAKSRLSPALTAAGRRDLMRTMLQHVLAVALTADTGQVWLASSDPTAPELAETAGCRVVSDRGLPWNAGLVAALDQIGTARPVLFLAGDLPLLTSTEVRTLVASTAEPGVVIGRAHDGGTNALGLNPAGLIVPCFGVSGSAAAHAARATDAGATARVLDLPGVALDVDTAADALRAGIPLAAEQAVR